MRVVRVSIRNVKSFRDKCTIEFDPDFNVLVGPNGGGKSNLLDIIVVILRHCFVKSYRVNTGRDASGPFKDLRNAVTFQNPGRFLDRFAGEPGDGVVEVSLCVSKEDLRSMRALRENKEALETQLNVYRNKPQNRLDFLDRWDPGLLEPDKVLEYTILNGELQPVGNNVGAQQYLEFLNYLEMFQILGIDVSEIQLTPNFLYFSPYRGFGEEDTLANLSGEDYYEQLITYCNSTSKTVISTVKLATLYFAAKHRRCEQLAVNQGYAETWRNDREVEQVVKWLRRLGYKWDLGLVDDKKNIYETTLEKDGRELTIQQASSGEKEIINFLLGVFAFDIHGGLIIADEPDLHLHPKWQNLLLEMLIELGIETRNQVIIATHSPAFITPTTIRGLRKISKDESGASKAYALTEGDSEARLYLVTSHKNERIFFADSVALVEGITDRLLFKALLDLYGRYLELEKVVEVVEVCGKDNFSNYQEFLGLIGVKAFVISDLDYALTIGDQEVRNLFSVDAEAVDKNVLCNKKSRDRLTLLETLEEAIESGDLEELRSFVKYLKGRHISIRCDLSNDDRNRLKRFISEKKRQGVFILSQGELEDYLPKGCTSTSRLIELTRDTRFKQWLANTTEEPKRKELDSIVFEILGVSEKEEAKVIGMLREEP